MLRVTTLHASTAAATAAYYAKYLTDAPGERPGIWSGRQATGLGLTGDVTVDQLELLLSGRNPQSATPLGRELLDRYTATGQAVRAVSGFDATFSAPKSVSVLWAVTGDQRLLDAHDTAVTAALAHLERFGSTTRIRSNGGRLHPDTQGLTIASFRQTTSRADDPQLHTHAVISAKVQTVDGRWLALDARYLKRHQRTLGGIYQSVLRAELAATLGVDWQPIVKGQAEIAGMPAELLERFSKRTRDIDHALKIKLARFRDREGREPSQWERGALNREASADTRSRKSGHGPTDLAKHWRTEAADVGWSARQLWDAVHDAARHRDDRVPAVTVPDVVKEVSSDKSTWSRADVIKAICDLQRPVAGIDGQRWAELIEDAADRVIANCVDLDPASDTARRGSDDRSMWLEPTAARYTSDLVLAQEEAIVAFVLDAHSTPERPSATVRGDGLDVLQGDAAAAVAGDDRVVLVVGPAGAGKTRMLAAAVNDLQSQQRPMFGLAPSAKAARVLEEETRLPADTVAKLLYEWQRPERPPARGYQLPAGTTVIVDEAGMLSTPALHQLVTLAEANRWRLALIGDPRQLQAVGRGGLFGELCASGRVTELEQLHRFTHKWEAAASLRLRHGDPTALDDHERHGRIIAGPLESHLDRMADTWITSHHNGDTVALVATTNEHVDIINRTVQQARLAAGHLHGNAVPVTGGEQVYVGDIITTRRNDRFLLTSQGQAVRNRDLWTVTTTDPDGSLTVSHNQGHGTVTLPADYIREHVRLGYAATEYGYQGDTVTTAISLATTATTRRGLYVAATRGRDKNVICVVTDSADVAEARDTLETILAADRAGIPAVTQRRTLAQQARAMPTRRPARPMRCSIPGWFNELVDDTRAELAAAQQRLRQEPAEQRREAQQLDRAERELDAAWRAAAPWMRQVSDAERNVEQATAHVVAAEQRLANARPWRRPAAQRDLATAGVDLATANQQLDNARTAAAPALHRFHSARDARAAADSAIHLRRLDAATNRPDRAVQVAQQRLDALDTWRNWANGAAVDPDHLRQITALDAALQDARFSHLVSAVHEWASDRNIDLPAHPRQQHHEMDFGLEI